jgi:hypothetical protein
VGQAVELGAQAGMGERGQGDRAHGRGGERAQDQAVGPAGGAGRRGGVDLAVDEPAQRLAGRAALVAAAGHEGELGRVGQADLERLALLQLCRFLHGHRGLGRAVGSSGV